MIAWAPVLPLESFTVSVTTLLPAESLALKLRPVPIWPSRLLVQTSAAPGERAVLEVAPGTGEGDVGGG